MTATAYAADPRLSPSEIESITGIEGPHPIAQRNRLRRMGIKAEVNARREVVCFSSWVAAAALQDAPAGQYIPESPANDETAEDIGMKLGALHG